MARIPLLHPHALQTLTQTRWSPRWVLRGPLPIPSNRSHASPSPPPCSAPPPRVAVTRVHPLSASGPAASPRSRVPGRGRGTRSAPRGPRRGGGEERGARSARSARGRRGRGSSATERGRRDREGRGRVRVLSPRLPQPRGSKIRPSQEDQKGRGEEVA